MVTNIHKRVIDREDEDLTGLLELRVVNVTRDVGAGASRAYIMVSLAS